MRCFWLVVLVKNKLVVLKKLMVNCLEIIYILFYCGDGLV